VKRRWPPKEPRPPAPPAPKPGQDQPSVSSAASSNEINVTCAPMPVGMIVVLPMVAVPMVAQKDIVPAHPAVSGVGICQTVGHGGLGGGHGRG
jgi:hypothetical protein